MFFPHEDNVDVITPFNILAIEGVACCYPVQHIVHRGWRILIPHGDIVDVITPINILFIGGGKF